MASIYGRPKLRIGVWKEAFAFPFRNFFTLLQFSLVPTLIVVAISVVMLHYAWPSSIPIDTAPVPEELERFLNPVHPALSVASFVATILALVIPVCIHRFIVLGEHPGWIFVRFGRYELAYAGAILVYVLVVLAIWMPIAAFIAASVSFGFVPAEIFTASGPLDPAVAGRLGMFVLLVAPGVLITIIVGCWIQARIALIFSDAAVAGRISLGVSWRAMKGNFWRFVAAVLILVLVSSVFWGVVGGVIFAVTANYFGFLSGFATSDPVQFANALYGTFLIYICLSPLYVFAFAMFVALISYVYADLVGARAAAR